jgi:hypothetical protein
MDDEITLEALLDDEDLQSELKSLGWSEPVSRSGGSSQRASNKAQNKPPMPSRPSKKVAASGRIEEDFDSPFNDAHFDIPSIDHIGVVDESSLKLEDHDLNDPELLSMYQDLEGNDSEEETEDDNDNENKKASSSSVPGHSESIPRVEFTSESVTNASNDILNYSNISAEEATKKALQFRRDGNTAEALKWFRLSKQLQNAKGPESIPLKSATGTVPAQTAVKSGPPTKASRNEAPIQVALPIKSVSTAKSILEKGNFVLFSRR